MKLESMFRYFIVSLAVALTPLKAHAQQFGANGVPIQQFGPNGAPVPMVGQQLADARRDLLNAPATDQRRDALDTIASINGSPNLVAALNQDPRAAQSAINQIRDGGLPANPNIAGQALSRNIYNGFRDFGPGNDVALNDQPGTKLADQLVQNGYRDSAAFRALGEVNLNKPIPGDTLSEGQQARAHRERIRGTGGPDDGVQAFGGPPPNAPPAIPEPEEPPPPTGPRNGSETNETRPTPSNEGAPAPRAATPDNNNPFAPPTDVTRGDSPSNNSARGIGPGASGGGQSKGYKRKNGASETGKQPEMNAQASLQDSMCVVFAMFEGYFGLLITLLAGIGALIGAAFGAYKMGVGLIGCGLGAFILRSLISVFFGSFQC